ncbi:MAG: DUF2099 family protein [bacterium]
MDNDLEKLKKIRERKKVNVISLFICNTGIPSKEIKKMLPQADLVWNCASQSLREIAGEKAITKLCPV